MKLAELRAEVERRAKAQGYLPDAYTYDTYLAFIRDMGIPELLRGDLEYTKHWAVKHARESAAWLKRYDWPNVRKEHEMHVAMAFLLRDALREGVEV